MQLYISQISLSLTFAGLYLSILTFPHICEFTSLSSKEKKKVKCRNYIFKCFIPWHNLRFLCEKCKCHFQRWLFICCFSLLKGSRRVIFWLLITSSSESRCTDMFYTHKVVLYNCFSVSVSSLEPVLAGNTAGNSL